MHLLPISVPRIRPGEDLTVLLYKEATIESGDIVVISSKAVATAEGAAIDLKTMNPSDEARALSKGTNRSPEFCEAMLAELTRLRGKVIGTVPGAALTEVRPEGLATGTILVANAGLDESNVAEGFAIGWPSDPVASIATLRKQLTQQMKPTFPRNPRSSDSSDTLESSIAVILTDSCCTPRRQGVTALALTASGLNPVQSLKGTTDLFGKPLKITNEAVADQLATAANFVMGNSAQSIPAVIIRDHGLELSDWEGWVPGIEPQEDLFGTLK